MGKFMFIAVIQIFSGIAIFIYGLQTISKGTESLILNADYKSFSKAIENPIGGAVAGALVASATQSGVAVSFITVGLVDLGVISFAFSAPIIMGANVGTTITAQLISLSGIGGVLIGAISTIIGLLASFFNNKWSKSISQASFGLGFIFVGISIMDSKITSLIDYAWFKNLFLIENPIVLFLNGLVMTAIMQSSSAVTGIVIILAGNGLVDFNSSVFITLGSNVGSCFSVIIASLDRSLQARRASVFNLCFNLIGSIIFFPIAFWCGDFITALFLNSSQVIQRAIANFHTVFNLICAILLLPFYKLLTILVCKIVKENSTAVKKTVFNKTFTRKSSRFN